MKLTIPGNPPRKNDHWKTVPGKGGKPQIRLTKNGAAFRRAMVQAKHEAVRNGEEFPEGPLFQVWITMYVKTMRHLDDISIPNRDLDSAISPVLDALQHTRIIDDDIRVEIIHPPARFKDRDNPRTEIEVTTWSK